MNFILSKSDLEQLNNFRIHELRDFARKYGVKSPTSLTKGEIIKELTAIADGSKQPYCNETKVGRPPINLKDKSNFFGGADNKFEEPLSSKDIMPKVQEDAITFSSHSAGVDILSKLDYFEGYYSNDYEAYGLVYNNILNSNQSIKVSQNLANIVGLRTGDFIKCGARKYIGNNYIVEEVYEVNGEKVPLSERPIFETLSGVYNKNRIVCDFDLPFDIYDGGSYFLKFENRKNLPNKAYELSLSLSKNNKVVFININADSDCRFAGNDNLTIFNVPFDIDYWCIAHSVNLILSNCKRRVENGENLCVVIDNIGELIKILDVSKKEVVDSNISADTLVWMNKIIACAKNTGNGNLTLFAMESFYLPSNLCEIIKFDLVPKFNNYNV